jgi:hypothetical protein
VACFTLLLPPSPPSRLKASSLPQGRAEVDGWKKKKRRRSLKQNQGQEEKQKTMGVLDIPLNTNPKRPWSDFHLLALLTLLTSAACLKLPPRLKRPLFGPPKLSDVSDGDAIGSVFVLGDRAGLPSLEVARTEPDRLALGRRTSLSR